MIRLLKTIVLDSNLVVSAILHPEGICALAIDLADTHFDMVRSVGTSQELVDVLRRDKFDRFAAVDDRAIRVKGYLDASRLVVVSISVADCSDPKDNKFLELALAAKASIIVSGDKKHLLSMSPYRGVQIIGVRDFVDHLARYI